MGVLDKGANRILVVDDDMTLRKLCVDALTGAGYLVDTAQNGEYALAKLRRAPYDLVVSDIEMPALDGIGLYRRVLGEHGYLRDRFIFMSGNLTGEVLNEVDEHNLKYLPKPFRLSDLVGLVRSVLAGPVRPDRESVCRLIRQDKRLAWQEDCFLIEDGLDTPVYSTTLDISSNGVKVRYEGRPFGTLKPLRVNIKPLSVNYNAHVVWSKPLNDMESVAGLRFSEPLPRSSMLLLTGHSI